MIARAFSSMPGLASGIARDIRDGNIKKYLIQPIDMLGLSVALPDAHKLVYYVVAIAPSPWFFFSAAAFSPAGPTARRWRLPRVAGDVVPAGLFSKPPWA